MQGQPNQHYQQPKPPSKIVQFFSGLCGAMCVNYATDGVADKLQNTGLLHGNDVRRFQDDLKYEAQNQIIDHYQQGVSLQGQQQPHANDHQD